MWQESEQALAPALSVFTADKNLLSLAGDVTGLTAELVQDRSCQLGRSVSGSSAQDQATILRDETPHSRGRDTGGKSRTRSPPGTVVGVDA